MADYHAHFRTNYFWTKNPKAFLAWVETIPDLQVHRFDEYREDSSYALFCDGSEPQFDADDNIFDIATVLPQYLADNEVAILMEIGHEKLRYLVGTAQAVHADGRNFAISLCDIYDRVADAFGVTATRAEN